MTAPMVLDGPMTSDWFLAHVEQVLVPTLRPGDIVTRPSSTRRSCLLEIPWRDQFESRGDEVSEIAGGQAPAVDPCDRRDHAVWR